MEQRYMKVRKQLDDLGYMQILIPESIPLVEKLTSDLIQTTESLQKYKTIAKDALEERNNLQFGAEPYKCDNAKLVKECNDLHLAFLQVREQNDKLQRDLKRRLSNLEKEKLESNSECEKLKRHIRDLELESARKTDRILTLQNKNFQAGGKSSAKSGSTFVSKSRSSVTSKSNVEMCSTAPKADQKLTELTNEIKKLKDEQFQLYETNESYKNQINNRDREIERLTKMLEGGRPLMALNKDCCYKDVEINMCRLQNQMLCLEKEKDNMEIRLKESLSKQHEAMERALQLAQRNKQLEQELRDIDEMALTVEADCNSTVRNNLEKVQKLQAKLHEMSLQMQTLERDVGDLKREKQELLSDLDAHKLEKKHLQSVLETALEDKKRLNDKINQLTIIEHDLNLEIDRLVQTSTNQKRKVAELECKILTEKFDASDEETNLHELDRVYTVAPVNTAKATPFPPRKSSKVPTKATTMPKAPNKSKKSKSPPQKQPPKRSQSAPKKTMKVSKKKLHKKNASSGDSSPDELGGPNNTVNEYSCTSTDYNSGNMKNNCCYRSNGCCRCNCCCYCNNGKNANNAQFGGKNGNNANGVGNNPNYGGNNANYGCNNPNCGCKNPNCLCSNANYGMTDGNDANYAGIIGNNGNYGGNNTNCGCNNPNYGGNNPNYGGNNPNCGCNIPNCACNYSSKENQTSLDHYKSERDYYMKEYQRLMEQTKNTIKPDCDHVADLVRRIKEKEEQIATLQHENKILAQEKHNLMTRLETVRDCTEDYNSLSLKSVIKKAEREREVLKGDIIRLEEERDALRHRLKMTTESQVDEHARMKKSVNEAEEQVRRLEQERRDLLQNQGSHRASISCLEEQCTSLKDQLRRSQTELAHQTTLYNQLKALHDQTDKALGDSQGQLNQVEVELCSCQERIRRMEKDRGGVDQDVADLRNEVLSLKGKLAQIDGEKDALLISLDDKTERIVALEQELQVKLNRIVTLENNLTELKKKLNMTEGFSQSKEDLLKNSEAERTSLRQELDAALRAKDSAILENRRVQNEWSAMSAECRCVTGELDQAKKQIEDLKRQLQQYVAEVKRFEDLMEKKESERNELLDQFRSLSQEAVLLENNNHSLENEATQSKVQLSVTLDHVTDLEHKLITQDDMLADYEKQIADLTSQIANMEAQICHCQQQQHRTDADLASVRDLCVKLDKQKDSLMHELHEKENDKSQTNMDLARMRQEFNTLQESTVRDRNTIENLEKLLADSREEAVQLRLARQDLEGEITKLKQKLEELQKRVFPPLTAAFTYSTSPLPVHNVLPTLPGCNPNRNDCCKPNCSPTNSSRVSNVSVERISSPCSERSKIQLETSARRASVKSGNEKFINSILPDNRPTVTSQYEFKNCTASCGTTSNKQNLSKPSSANSGSFKSTLAASNRVQICTPDNCPKFNPANADSKSPSLRRYSHRTS